MLKWLAIGLGVLIIITRGAGVLFPGRMKAVWRDYASNKTLLRATGVTLLVFSFLVIVALGGHISGARFVMWILAIVCFAGGLVLAFLPKQYGALVNWFMKLPDETSRVLSGIGLAVGVIILILGLVYY